MPNDKGTIMMYHSADGSLQIKVIAKDDDELEADQTSEKEQKVGISDIGLTRHKEYYDLDMIPISITSLPLLS